MKPTGSIQVHIYAFIKFTIRSKIVSCNIGDVSSGIYQYSMPWHWLYLLHIKYSLGVNRDNLTLSVWLSPHMTSVHSGMSSQFRFLSNSPFLVITPVMHRLGKLQKIKIAARHNSTNTSGKINVWRTSQEYPWMVEYKKKFKEAKIPRSTNSRLWGDKTYFTIT